MATLSENNRYIVQVFVGALSAHYEALSVEASKLTTSEEIVTCIVDRLVLTDSGGCYELAEVVGDTVGGECKERRLGPGESPVALMLLWPKEGRKDEYYRFYLREKLNDTLWSENFSMDPQVIKDYFYRFLYQPKDREYPDLCQLPDLNEQTLLENLRARFVGGHIYTYVGSILIAVNPFKFHPIYNPKYVKLYQNRRLGPSLPPHIFAVADASYHCMLKDRKNQCIVISGESGSGKTESTNFLLHHLTTLSQKGSHGSGVEQTILSAGPVLEAFGNAKTAHNNNSSRFGKFIQVNYKENGMVHGAVVQKYLLEKSRICSQGRNERNYHVFYYLLAGASDAEKQQLHLKNTDQYNYLSRSGCYVLDNVDEKYEFSRLKQSMEMVGFTAEKQRRLFAVLSAVLLLGNIEFQPKKSAYHHDESVCVKNPEVVLLISELLRVKEETLLAALTAKRARASGETLVINYRLPEAIAARDAMAKCLYGALFDWIVMQVNHALLSKKDTLRDHQGNSIGVLDIFGFEDFGLCNSFEQLCINYANEHLQFYFNQHVFKYEQQEYRKEAIRWNDIGFMDNTGCLQLIETKPDGLLCVLDDQCNFPGATNETLLQKFNSVHKNNDFYEKPQKKEPAFIVRHYAGKVKYQVTEMREKNLDLMRQDIVGVLKNSSMAFVRELVGADPVAVFRWAIVRAFFRGYFAFQEAGRRHRAGRAEGSKAVGLRYRNHTPNETLISHLVTVSAVNLTVNRIALYQQKQRNTILATTSTTTTKQSNESSAFSNNIDPSNRISWPAFQNRSKSNSANNASAAANTQHDNEKRYRHRKDSAGAKVQSYERGMCPDEARVMAKAEQIVMKNKSFRPRERGKKGLKNLQTVKTLAGRTGLTSNQNQQPGKARKQPLTVTAQFQQSLHSLMDTLNQANPFFIRCIKSNGNKIPNKFDENTVQRQLRYTGMLETVRIRQAGYNVRLTYDEFIQLYRILLPKGLLSSQADVRHYLATLNLNRDNYQLGSSKIFLRESEKNKLDFHLHQQIMASIVSIQRWFRARLERKRFIRIRASAVMIQSYWRMFYTQQCLALEKSKRLAAVVIQAAWKGYKERTWFKGLKDSVVGFQAKARGFIVRKKVGVLRKQIEARAQLQREKEREIEMDRVKRDSITSASSKYSSRGTPYSGASAQLSTPYTPTSHFTEAERAPLRPTQSLPQQTATARTYELTPEENPFDQTNAYMKRKVTKTAKTVDLSEIENVEKQINSRKSSYDSLSSSKSLDSNRSIDVNCSFEHAIVSPHAKDTLSKARRLLIGKKEGHDDLMYEFDSNYATGRRESTSTVWQKRESISSEYLLDSKTRIERQKDESTSEVSASYQQSGNKWVETGPVPVRREIRYNQDGKLMMAQQTEPRPEKVEIVIVNAAIERSPTKVVTNTVKIPDVPLRAVRKPRREYMCRSVGEELTDIPPVIDGKAAALLGTIREDLIPRRNRLSGSDESSHVIKIEREAVSPTLIGKRQRGSALTGLESLRRRNSDPATKVGIVDMHPEGTSMLKIQPGYVMEWKNSNLKEFSVAGHHFQRVARFSKEDRCDSCNNEVDAFVTHGYKCAECKMVFHTKCIQNGGAMQMPCSMIQTPSGARRKPRKQTRTAFEQVKQTVAGKFSLTGTSMFTDSTDKIISDAKELQQMQDFITKKIYKMESEEGQKPSEVDRVFKHALREFKDNLVACYSVSNRQGLNIKYKDLIGNFLHVMETICTQEQKPEDFAVTMCVNAFRGFMNEFMTSRAEADKPKAKRKKEKKRKAEDHITYAGHTFLLTIINIPTACEICTSFFMWPIERGLVCQACKLTCHKKCYARVTQDCGGGCKDTNDGTRIFGVPLKKLNPGEGKVPIVVDRLLTTIEMYGLYTEGIYRKSGVSSKVKELKMKIDESPQDGVDFEGYQVHVLASVLKSFLRDMPEPLLTFDCYDDFIRAANLTDPADRVSTLFSILKKLPKQNFDLMERLIFHLARVALHEETNRMNAGALAIVFAPCILRTNKPLPAQDSLNDIGRQTQCIETIITEQLRKVRATLADIDTLDTACHTATHRLSSLRSSKVFSPEELLPPEQPDLASPDREDEEALLVGHIQEIQKEKALLTSALPSLTRATSDDDLLSTDLDGESGSLDDIPGSNDQQQPPRRAKLLITRSISGGHTTTHSLPKMQRQSSSEQGNCSTMDECDDDHPIMV